MTEPGAMSREKSLSRERVITFGFGQTFKQEAIFQCCFRIGPCGECMTHTCDVDWGVTYNYTDRQISVKTRGRLADKESSYLQTDHTLAWPQGIRGGPFNTNKLFFSFQQENITFFLIKNKQFFS